MVASIRFYFLYSTYRQHKTSDVRAERHGVPLVLELHDLQGGNNVSPSAYFFKEGAWPISNGNIL